METTIEALEETARWFDSLPQITEEEVDELARLDAMKHKGCYEL